MPYKVIVPEATVLEKIGEIRDPKGEFISYEHQSKLYTQDQIVSDDVISPVIVDAYNNGDEHTLSIFERVEEEAESAEKPKRRTTKAASVKTDDGE